MARPQLISPVTYQIAPRPQLVGPVTFELVTVLPPVVLPPVTPSDGNGRVQYFLGITRLADLGVQISKSTGLLDALERKEPTRYDWADQHGVDVDLAKPVFGARTITLEGWISARSVSELHTRWQAFTDLLAVEGTQRLHVQVFDHKPLVYEVFRQKLIEFKQRWMRGKIIVSFTLTLEEPKPIKRVLQFDGPGTLTLVVTSTPPIAIHWGDGRHTYDVRGNALTVSHRYDGTGRYYCIIAGDLAALTLTHNATVLWQQL